MGNNGRQKLRFRPHGVVLNIIIAAVVLELISGLQFYHTRQLLADELEKRAETELTMKILIVKSTLNLSENSLRGHLLDMENTIANPESLYDVMERVLLSHPNLIGCWVAFIPDYYPERAHLYEPYAYWENGEIKKHLIGMNHDYSNSIYFKRVIQQDDDIWTDPYLDSISGYHMVSYAVPIHDKKNDVVAVFGLDVPTKILGDTLNYRQIYESSYNLVLTKDGQLVAGPDSSRVSSNKVEYIARIINDSTVTKRYSKSGNCQIATFHDPDNNEKGYVYYASFKGKPDWQLAVVCYDYEVFGKLRQMYLTIVLTILAGIIILGFIISYFIKNNRKLNITKKEKALIDKELHIASNIQMQMLPKQMAQDERDDLDIYTSLTAAKEVGGDLFDFFVRNEKLYFCIGDVSGKGVPASLVMAVVHSLFRMACTRENNPAHIMQSLNVTACEGNDSNIFVTMFIGILDLPTGRLRYCNAGHDLPLLIGQETTELTALANMPIGLFGDFHYKTEQTMVPPNTTLLLFTDGLTEAMNLMRKQFGLNRVKEIVSGHGQSSSKELLEMIAGKVKAFTQGAPQSDDLTMMAIRYTPHQEEDTLNETLLIKNHIKDVEQLNVFVGNITHRLGYEEDEARSIRLAVEEAVVNVVCYAYSEDQEGDISIVAQANSQRLKFIITDSGIPFDPTEASQVDITLPAEERRIGGLGIHLVRELMDSINYEREDGKNILTLVKKIPKIKK